MHHDVMTGATAVRLDAGRPGGSLEREYQRRRAVRGRRITQLFPTIGGAVLAVTPEPPSLRALRIGAAGQRKVAERLASLYAGEAMFLHNRRAGDGDIDHIAIGPAGVYVIETKFYEGSIVRVRRTGGRIAPARDHLLVNGRDRTQLVEGLAGQVALVREALGDVEVPVTPVLCLVGADLPLLERLTVDGVPVRGSRATAHLVRCAGPFDTARRFRIWERLATELPPA